MERMQADTSKFPERPQPGPVDLGRFQPTPIAGSIAGMVRLPGEVLQAHLEN
jgi:hypothetical protein